MPQLNPDEAANDEPKTYNLEDGDGWQDSKDLNDIKGDLVEEDDGDPIPQLYDNKGNSHRNEERGHRSKDGMERDHQKEMGSLLPNFPYPQQDIGSIVSGLSRPIFPNSFLPPSSQVSYPPYMGPYMGLFRGASSPIDLDGKQGPPRPPQPDIPQMYPLPGQLGQVPNPLVPWSPGPLYPLCTASAMAGMLRYPYPFHNFSSTSGAMGSVSPFPLVPPHPHSGGLHPNMLHPGSLPLPGHMMNGQTNGGGKAMSDKKTSNPESAPPKRTKGDKPNRPYVKKPLNAFMIYMKEQRAQVVAECTLKESAAINQILGRKWHSLNRDEQQKYYEMARKERQLHMQMFPGWSARDNYGKRKKRKKEKTQDCTAQNPKKCRAVFGLEQQQLWRKKKCIRYQHDGDDSDDSDASIGPYQESPEGPYSFDSGSQSALPQSSTSATGTSSDQSRPSQASERLSPGQPMVTDQIKQEKSPPLPHDPNVPCSNDKNADNMYHPPTSSFNSSSNEASSSSAHSTISNKKSPRTNDSQNHSLPKSSESFRPPAGNLNGFPAASKTGPDGRNRRSNSSHPESPLNNSSNRQTMFNSPLLSPAAMGLNSPHSNPLLPHQFSYLAANLPTSPIGSFMSFSGFKGLTSPMSMGLSGPGASVAPGGHPGSSATRRPSSALEGKS